MKVDMQLLQGPNEVINTSRMQAAMQYKQRLYPPYKINVTFLNL